MKDLDFDEFFPSGINLEKKYYDLLKTTTKNDTLVLQECNIFDYSFLLAIVKPTNQKIIEGKSYYMTRIIKWGASSRLPFGPNFAWGSIETPAIGKKRPIS